MTKKKQNQMSHNPMIRTNEERTVDTETRLVELRELYQDIIARWDALLYRGVVYVNTSLPDDSECGIFCKNTQTKKDIDDAAHITAAINRLYKISGLFLSCQMIIDLNGNGQFSVQLHAQNKTIEKLGTRELVEALKKEFLIIEENDNLI